MHLLKKETRILGLSYGRERRGKIPVVGVVYRGSLWLDGAFICMLERKRRNHSSILARAIKQTKQYSQVYAAILFVDKRTTKWNASALGDELKLPTITIIGDHPGRNSREKASTGKKELSPYELKLQGIPVNLRVKASELVRDVFAVSCAPGCRVPEPVRVAKLLADGMQVCNEYI